MKRQWAHPMNVTSKLKYNVWETHMTSFKSNLSSDLQNAKNVPLRTGLNHGQLGLNSPHMFLGVELLSGLTLMNRWAFMEML